MNLRPIRFALAALLIVAAATNRAPAQSADRTRQLEQQLRDIQSTYVLPANRALSITERAFLDYGALLNFTFIAADDSDQRTRILRQYDVQAYGHLSIDGVHEFFGRARYTYRDFNHGDSFDGRGDRALYPLYDRAWYRFDLARAIEAYSGETAKGNIVFQGGRQWVDWASGMALSQQLYAARVWVEIPGPALEAEFLVGATPSSSVIDFDSSRPSHDRDTDRLFLGAKLAYTGILDHEPYIFVLKQKDNNTEDSTVISIGGVPPANYPTNFDYNSTYWGIGSSGTLIAPRLEYTAEFIYESGDSLSTPFNDGFVATAQTRDPITAWAARGLLTYVFDDERLNKIDAELVLASGDGDRVESTTDTFGGNRRNTNDEAFNAFGYVNTGLAFNGAVSNLMMVRVGGSTYPLRSSELFKHLEVGADFFVFNKLEPAAPFGEPTVDRRFLGVESDVYANWRITSDVSLNVRYGVFFPGKAIDGDSDERHFLLTSVTYSF